MPKPKFPSGLEKEDWVAWMEHELNGLSHEEFLGDASAYGSVARQTVRVDGDSLAFGAGWLTARAIVEYKLDPSDAGGVSNQTRNPDISRTFTVTFDLETGNLLSVVPTKVRNR